MLRHSPLGLVAWGSLIARLRASIGELPSCKAFIRRFLRDSIPLLRCEELLRNRGLSRETAKECEVLLGTIPSSSPVRTGFCEWMKRQLGVAERLGLSDKGLPISSDRVAVRGREATRNRRNKGCQSDCASLTCPFDGCQDSCRPDRHFL